MPEIDLEGKCSVNGTLQHGATLPTTPHSPSCMQISSPSLSSSSDHPTPSSNKHKTQNRCFRRGHFPTASARMSDGATDAVPAQ